MSCKRFLLLLGIVLAVGVVTQAFARNFADVIGTRYQTAFSYLSEKEVIGGYPDGTGKPYGFLNRAEAVKVLMEVHGGYSSRIEKHRKNPSPLPLFPDAPVNAWYAPYLEVAFEEGLITGYPDGSFRPGQLVRTEEGVALLMRNYKEKGESQVQNSTAIENRPGEWFSEYINGVIKKNVASRREQMRLGAPLTRGQFFDMVYRLDSIEDSGDIAFESDDDESIYVGSNGSSNSPVTYPNSSNSGGNGGNGSSVVTYPNSQVPSSGGSSGSRPQYASQKYFAITMPTLGITDLTITHPQDALTEAGIMAPLQAGVGHLYSYPGGNGKIMIYGHSSGYPWDLSEYTKIFRQINKLNEGDLLYVTYNGKLFTYEVTYEETIQASDTSDFDDHGDGEELILYTCWPPDSITQRYLIHASLVDSETL